MTRVIKAMSSPVLPSSLFKWLAIASGVLFLVAIGFLPAAHRRDQSTHWPTTMGTISANGLRLNLHKPNVEPGFTPEVCYSYTVDGIPRTGTEIEFSDNKPEFPKEKALAWLQENYPVGKPVTVHYAPNDPDLAVLVPGAADLVFICHTMIAALGLCCVVAVGMYRRAKWREANDTAGLGGDDSKPHNLGWG